MKYLEENIIEGMTYSKWASAFYKSHNRKDLNSNTLNQNNSLVLDTHIEPSPDNLNLLEKEKDPVDEILNKFRSNNDVMSAYFF